MKMYQNICFLLSVSYSMVYPCCSDKTVAPVAPASSTRLPALNSRQKPAQRLPKSLPASSSRTTLPSASASSQSTLPGLSESSSMVARSSAPTPPERPTIPAYDFGGTPAAHNNNQQSFEALLRSMDNYDKEVAAYKVLAQQHEREQNGKSKRK